MSVNYIKLGGYEYDDNPNESTICFGRDTSSVFMHQIIENTDMEQMDLSDAVKITNDATLEYASTQAFEIKMSEPQEIMVDGNMYAICQQEMSFDDGNHAVQQNIYFYDPDDSVFRMVQFGTIPMSSDAWEQYGEELTAYTFTAIRQLLNNIATPPSAFHIPIKRFVVAG